MENLSPGYLSLISSQEVDKGALPFWLFYLLLSVILLLIFINFLQNKELRQKISYLLAGPRRRLNKLRLLVILKKEEQKKAELLRRLGELTAIKWPDLPEIEEIASEIRSLEEKNTKFQSRWHEIYKQIEALKAQRGQLVTSEDPDQNKSARLEEVDKEISSLSKALAEVQDNIMALDELLQPHHETIGRVVYRLRPDREDLAFLFFQIDRAEEKIIDLKKKIENL